MLFPLKKRLNKLWPIVTDNLFWVAVPIANMFDKILTIFLELMSFVISISGNEEKLSVNVTKYLLSIGPKISTAPFNQGPAGKTLAAVVYWNLMVE